MTTRLPSTLLAAALLAASTLGCAGGQTGDEGEAAACDEVKTALTVNETSALGYSAADVLAYVEGRHTASFEWQPATSVPYGPEQGAAELQLDVESLGRARFVERTVPQNRPVSLEAAGCCTDSVQLDVRVTLQTSGGALNETFDAVLDARTKDAAQVSLVIKPPFAGDLSFDGAALGTAHVEDLQIELHFEPDALSGQAHARFEETSSQGPDSSVSLTTQLLAEWGPHSVPQHCSE